MAHPHFGRLHHRFGCLGCCTNLRIGDSPILDCALETPESVFSKVQPCSDATRTCSDLKSGQSGTTWLKSEPGVLTMQETGGLSRPILNSANQTNSKRAITQHPCGLASRSAAVHLILFHTGEIFCACGTGRFPAPRLENIAAPPTSGLKLSCVEGKPTIGQLN